MTVDTSDGGAGGVGSRTRTTRPPTRPGMSILAFAGFASLAAGAVHAAAVGIHAEHPQLARVFVVTAVLQMGVGLWIVVRPTRLAAWAVVAVNIAAVIGWLVTRLTGLSFIDGLEVREAPQFADTACAALGVVAVVAAYASAILPASGRRRQGLALPSVALGALTVWTMMAAGTHVHSHDAGHEHGTETAVAEHDHTATGSPAADGAVIEGASGEVATTVHAHDDATAASTGHSHDTAAALTWPRPWDPAQPIDVSGVQGVTTEQEVRAVTLIQETLGELPRYADPADAIAEGYVSIGDAGTGSEHFINGALIEDDALLDPSAPESLVYNVVDGQRTLAGAMYIASSRPTDDPSLTDWAGPLMTWHKHDNLCWAVDANGQAKVVGIVDADGNCANGVRAGGGNPMVHVWITPHPCGVFAALEGVGAGTAAVPEADRVDMCAAAHDHGTAASGNSTAAVPKPYDPTLPIDLSGTTGVSPEQQAAAENLIAVTLVRLPKWSDYEEAVAAGFHSIGDAATGHEHFVQWDWIDDDVTLDPDHPESLVYEPQPDGSKKLVSAMYMLPSDVALENVPDIGGALMQWHIHDNLCFTTDPEAPQVAGVTSSNGDCPSGLQTFVPAPMIHVWITAHRCGPFAALEGVGAGQIQPGEERLCDHDHGAGF
jgi:hypothetical protein